MRITQTVLALGFLILSFVSDASGQEKPSLREIDRVRLAEAFNLGEKLGDELWAGWTKAPFAVLLVTPEHEFLLRHPRPTDEFKPSDTTRA